jgi:hypothetical protein
MRLLSVSVTAAVMTFGLVAALGVTAAMAQEQPTRQTFETREITGPEAAPETTQTPERSDAQASAKCQGATLIDTVGPTDQDLATRRPIPIAGESFRLTYETTDADESGLPFFDVTVLDAAGKEVGGQVIFDEGVVREIVRASPGRFDIETRAEDLKYKLTIEDCTGGANPPPGGGGGQPSPTNPGDQYGNGTDNPDDVVDDTTSGKPLPNTGGVPLFGLGFFGFVCVFAAFALLRPVIRRDS